MLMSWIYYILPSWVPNLTRPQTFPFATRWRGRKGHNDYNEARLFKRMPYAAESVTPTVISALLQCPSYSSGSEHGQCAQAVLGQIVTSQSSSELMFSTRRMPVMMMDGGPHSSESGLLPGITSVRLGID
ncbi:hypothetical protein PIB30_028617 [Stylosanthes scabra]|uniref:Uncharacterized protein n=1 Tax=Stylosanthes scabra TaxID=79078 RepID=A0ABU6Y868_9FABA|nr:hypothetical protein [Stylosanthes scabra]